MQSNNAGPLNTRINHCSDPTQAASVDYLWVVNYQILNLRVILINGVCHLPFSGTEYVWVRKRTTREVHRGDCTLIRQGFKQWFGFHHEKYSQRVQRSGDFSVNGEFKRMLGVFHTALSHRMSELESGRVWTTVTRICFGMKWPINPHHIQFVGKTSSVALVRISTVPRVPKVNVQGSLACVITLCKLCTDSRNSGLHEVNATA